MVFNHYISRLTGVEYENFALHCWGLSKIQNQKRQLTLPTDNQSMLTLNVRRGLKAQSCCFIKLPQLDGPAWSEMRHPRITLLRDLGCQVWNKYLEMEHFDGKKKEHMTADLVLSSILWVLLPVSLEPIPSQQHGHPRRIQAVRNLPRASVSTGGQVYLRAWGVRLPSTCIS